ncbi:FAD-binding oxidoreductase [Arenibacter sp. M-2]|uniref:NAD(P)/FAD-dependent oxidoreductase n=1 Tax=Arenibacter sp. M-2 TaxID=3053612 RepID=UPI00257116BC|nr:FAD-binding oxidoreductase [Arenibacter sp. M-2]MDL5514360.1 FAD-binding oxidoreductase [Arenibacter sp. M-2]
MRVTDDGRFLIGGGDVDFINSKKRDGLINSKVQQLHRHINRIFPSFNIITDFAWAGTFGKTKDGLPYIGEHPDFKSTYFVLGFGGNGITFSVIGMKIISDLLKGTMHDLSQYYRFGR